MRTVIANPERTEFKVVWNRKGEQIVVAVFATYEEAVKCAWPKY